MAKLSFRTTLIWTTVIWTLIPMIVVAGYLLVRFSGDALSQGQTQLNRETQQLSGELQRLFGQAQIQLVRLSEQGAVVKSATVSFLSSRAIQQMESFKSQYKMASGVLLLDSELFAMEAVPTLLLGLDLTTIEPFLRNIVDTQYNRELASVLPRTTFYQSEQLAKIVELDSNSEFIVFAQPVFSQTNAIGESHTVDGIVLVFMNIKQTLDFAAERAQINMVNHRLDLSYQSQSWFSTSSMVVDSPIQTSQQAVFHRLDTETDFLELSLSQHESVYLENVRDAFTNVALFTSLMVLIILAASYVFSRRMLAPFYRLSTLARRMSEGQFSQTLPTSAFKEVQELQQLLLSMGVTIEAQVAQLQKANAELEMRVNERTQALSNSVDQYEAQTNLMRGLMQVTIDIQSTTSETRLVNQLIPALDAQFPHHDCGILINRLGNAKAIVIWSSNDDVYQTLPKRQLDRWRFQSVDFRVEHFAQRSWFLVPIRDNSQQVIGQLVFIGEDLTTPQKDVVVILSRLIASVLDQVRLTKKMERIANTDALTSLSNRLYFEKRLQRAIEQYQSFGIEFAVFVIDVNGLKRVNDNYGHEQGDQMIIRTAAALSQCSREQDTLARVGGDEFYMLASDTNQLACDHIQDRLIQAQKSLHLTVFNHEEKVRLPITYSVGAACTEQDLYSQLVRLADERMYANKQRQKA